MPKRRPVEGQRPLINRYSGACEGLQERLYFSRLTELIRLEPARKYDVEFKLASADGGSPLVVAKKAASITLDTHPRVAVFDRGASRTVQAIVYYDNPDLSVHTVVEDALIKAGLYTL